MHPAGLLGAEPCGGRFALGLRVGTRGWAPSASPPNTALTALDVLEDTGVFQAGRNPGHVRIEATGCRGYLEFLLGPGLCFKGFEYMTSVDSPRSPMRC